MTPVAVMTRGGQMRPEYGSTAGNTVVWFGHVGSASIF